MPGQAKRALSSFRIKDLMVNVISRRGGGGTSYPADDSPPLPTPITPVVRTAILARKIQAFQKLTIQPELLDAQFMDRFAMDLGWEVLGSAYRCLEDAPTCRVYPRLSLVASVNFDRGLDYSDLAVVKADLEMAIAKIGELEEASLANARKDNGELIPKLREAIEQLEAQRKP